MSSLKDLDEETIAKLREILAQVPRQCRGSSFKPLLRNLDDPASIRELMAVMTWADWNNHESSAYGLVVESLFLKMGPPTRQDIDPFSERDWSVAAFAIATVIQWLFTPQGMSFLDDVVSRIPENLSDIAEISSPEVVRIVASEAANDDRSAGQ